MNPICRPTPERSEPFHPGEGYAIGELAARAARRGGRRFALGRKMRGVLWGSSPALPLGDGAGGCVCRRPILA